MNFHKLWIALALALIVTGSVPTASARAIKVKPKTSHSSLTQTTDGSVGYQVLPGKPLRLDLVGPGNMVVTVRLNGEVKRTVFKGRLEIRRGSKIIKRANLKLHRSRVGAYRENSSIYPSLPKVFKIKVPQEVQSYTFSVRAGRGISLTVQIRYDSEADQGKVSAVEEDSLALVPLVPPNSTASGEDSDEIPLAPLAPLEKETPAKVAAKKTVVAASPKKTTIHEKAKAKVAMVTVPEPAKKNEPPKPVKAPDSGDKMADSSRVIRIPAPKEPVSVEKPANPSRPILSVGVKAGQISPLQVVGGTTYTASLDIRFVLPVFDDRLTLGVEGGFYPYSIVVTGKDVEINLSMIPVSLQLFYRLPLGTFLEPFLGLGGDLFIWSGESKVHSDGNKLDSGSGVGFGGHVSAGIEAEAGPGFIMVEARAGISLAFLDGVVGWGGTPNLSGISTVVGYRFQF